MKINISMRTDERPEIAGFDITLLGICVYTRVKVVVAPFGVI